MKGAIRKIFWLYALLFLAMVIYLLKISIYDSNSFVANTLNPRLSQGQEGIKRGSILDINGDVIAESVRVGEDDEGKPTYKRVYNNSEAYSHVVGYMDKGKAGVESKYNFRLEDISFELFQRISGLFGNDIEGNNVVLTIDDRLQKIAYSYLEGQKGSIVALEPSTGKILAMVSNPNFDSNTVGQNWEELNSDDENSPLLNRATQGLYPPGSTFKIVTSAAGYEYDKDSTDLEMDCKGEKKFGNSIMHCYNNNAHGNEGILKAFAKSCNTFFATLGEEIGTENLAKTAEDFGFNQEINFPLEYRKSTFSLNSQSSQSEIIETSIGQGKTLVSPLFMAMITGAVANSGRMMNPYIVDHSETPWGGVRNKTIPSSLRQAIAPNTAYKIKDLMIEVCKSGTATNAAFSVDGKIHNAVSSDSAVSSGAVAKYSGPITVAGKTGTAENASGDDHAWFVGFAPAEDPQIAVAVIFENAGKGSKAIPAARDVMKEYISNLEE
ncbi:MAG: peptidoglycan D,D-transpeptidase FtsI family protein [Lachnospirales bacterium]